MRIKKGAPDPRHRRIKPRFHGLLPALQGLLRRNRYLFPHSMVQFLEMGQKIDCLDKRDVKHSVATVSASLSASDSLGMRLPHGLKCLVNGKKSVSKSWPMASLTFQNQINRQIAKKKMQRKPSAFFIYQLKNKN